MKIGRMIVNASTTCRRIDASSLNSGPGWSPQAARACARWTMKNKRAVSDSLPSVIFPMSDDVQ